MSVRYLVVAAAVLLAGCAPSNGSRPEARVDGVRPLSVDGPDLTAYLAIGGVT